MFRKYDNFVKMNVKMDVPNVITELVKNSIDARCTVLEIELNDTFDVRVTDDGCGFNEQILHDVGIRMDTLFGKFEHFLESNGVFSKLRFVSCQKDNVKVELFLCENGISSKSFQFAYLNKSIDSDGKWKKIINALCEKRFEKDLNAKFAVYLADIRVKNHLDNILVENVIVNNCIKKCIEQMSQTSSKCEAEESTNVRKSNSRNVMENLNGGDLGTERKIQGVRLGHLL